MFLSISYHILKDAWCYQYTAINSNKIRREKQKPVCCKYLHHFICRIHIPWHRNTWLGKASRKSRFRVQIEDRDSKRSHHKPLQWSFWCHFSHHFPFSIWYFQLPPTGGPSEVVVTWLENQLCFPDGKRWTRRRWWLVAIGEIPRWGRAAGVTCMYCWVYSDDTL